MKVSQILDSAADVIDRNGRAAADWFTHVPGRRPEECPVDAWGAINIACGYAPDNPDTRSVAPARALALHLGMTDTGDHIWPVKELGAWSDADDRAAGQVAAEMRATASELRRVGR